MSDGAGGGWTKGMGEAVPDARVSSRELRVFGGVEIGRHRFLAGETAFPALPGHLVNVHLRAPTRVETRRDGTSWEGTQTVGNVEVFSADKATGQVLVGASEDASVLLGKEFFGRVAAEVGVEPDRFEILDSFEARDPNIQRILLYLLPELETGGLGGEVYAQSMATALAVHLLREHSSLGLAVQRRIGEEPKDALPERVLRLVAEHVDENLSGEISLGDMAAVARLSTRHFLRLFRRSTGHSPYQ
ncbi:MAG: hypothetical protein ACRDTR_09080, partial [Rubrobacter sp.]